MKLMHVTQGLSIIVVVTIKVIIRERLMDSINTFILIVSIRVADQQVIRQLVVILARLQLEREDLL